MQVGQTCRVKTPEELLASGWREGELEEYSCGHYYYYQGLESGVPCINPKMLNLRVKLKHKRQAWDEKRPEWSRSWSFHECMLKPVRDFKEMICE